MRIARSVVLLALALPLVACSDRSDPMGAATATDLPAFTANLESQGAVVERYQANIAITWWDPATELLAAHVFRDPYGACMTPGTPVDYYRTSVKDVISSRDSEGAELVRELMQSKEISIKVWHSTNGVWSVALRCSEPLAEGVGQVLYTDNDAVIYQSDRVHANAFGWVAQATLTGPDGARYHYNSVFRTKWQPNSGVEGDRYHEVIKINLTPIGK